MSSEITFSAFHGKTIVSLVVLGIVFAGMIWWKSSSVNARPTIAIGSIALIVAIAGFIFWQLGSIRMQVDNAHLTVSSGLYRVSLPMEQIERDAVRIREAGDKDYALKWRTNGIGLPGLAIGWFTSNASKIFATITDPDKVVIIPTRSGYTILVSPDDPERLLETIRSL